MPPNEEDFGVDAIDSSIKKMELKLETLREVKRILRDTKPKAELNVIDADDSALIEIIVKADEPIDEMQELANTDRFLMGESHNPDDIVYDHQEDQFKLKTEFRTDR